MEKITEFNWDVTSNETKKHISGDFLVNKPYHKLVFECSYSPKYLEDAQKGLAMMREAVVKADYLLSDFPDEELIKNMPLANHIGWSIDSPVELLGTKHNHNPNQRLEISHGRSTPGFKNTPIYEGKWTITASLNAVLTDKLTIHIVISGDDGDELV